MAAIALKRIKADIASVHSDLDKWDKSRFIFYNYNESNIQEGHAMLVGVEDSPYFSGFYFFHNTFPDSYPFVPPSMKFLTNDGRTRFNPNLYQINGNGKVCLSILNTWGESTWSQVQRFSNVLETMRAHLFHDKPLVNEPGYSEKDPMNEIYNRMIAYQNLNFNIYFNICQTPDYAKPFLPVMKEIFMTNKDYFRKYIDENKHLHGKTESIRYDSQTVTYDFEKLEKKYEEILKACS